MSFLTNRGKRTGNPRPCAQPKSQEIVMHPCAPDLLTLIVTVIRVHNILTESRLGDVSSDVVAGKAIGNNDPGRSYIYYAENPECSSFPNVHPH